MKSKLTLLLLLLGLGFLLNTPNALAQSQSYSLTILESTAERVIVELTLPPLKAETVALNGQKYHQISAGDGPLWGQPGQPALPMFSLPLAMPTADTPQIAILKAEFDNHNDILLAPNPKRIPQGSLDAPALIEDFSPDANAYRQNKYLPGPLAEAAEPGILRRQAMFQLRLYPYQYNPAAQSLKVYRRLTIEVRFSNAKQTLSPHAPPVFEELLRNALPNYDALPRAQSETRIISSTPTLNKASVQARLAIEAEGLYRLTYANLQATVPALVQGDPRHLQLSNGGNPIPIYIEGESDGSFDPNDYIIFYGEAIDSVYTRQNIYFLADVGQPAARMSQRNVAPAPGTAPVAFENSQHFEQDKTYWQALPNGTGKDHWFWTDLTVSSATPVSASYTFSLNNLPTSGANGSLRVQLQGFTSGSHKTQLYLNGTPLLAGSSQNWSGQSEKLYQISVAHSLFNEGSNTLKVEAILPGGTSVSEFYVNWFEIDYQDSYSAENNSLRFSAPTTGPHAFEVNNFSAGAISLLDVSNPASPIWLINHQTTPNGAGYSLRFNDTAGPQNQFIAYQTSQLPAPAAISAYQPTNWASPANGATYLIITHPSFGGPIQDLATYRAAQGETVEVITTDEIYNEFNYGIYDPQGIKNFLEYAYANWSPQPVYVLLVGDASMDPKNNRGSSLSDLLPAIFVDTPLFGEAPNDAWYAKVDGNDPYPDLIVGRLPVRWGSEVENISAKIQSYEQSPPPGGWQRRAILVADDNDPSFAADMDNISAMLPASMTAVQMYNYNAATSVKNEVNTGGLFLAYSGHGSTGIWGKWNNSHDIFGLGDIQSLSNGNRLPFMTVANCLNGFFASYSSDHAMAEEWLVLDSKGGIASWAPASYAFPSVNQLINAELYKSLLVDGDLAFGSAATTARIQAYLQRPDFSLDLYEVFTYFGDPAVQLNLPANINFGGAVNPNPVAIGGLIDYTLSYTVSGNGSAQNLNLENTLPDKVTYLSANPPPSTVYGQTLSWNLGNVAGGSYTVTISGRVKTSGVSHGQTLQNQATLSDDSGFNQTLFLNAAAQDTPISGLSAGNSGPVEFGNPVTLSAASAGGSNIVYTWNPGDGSPAKTGASVQHTYAAVDSYIASVSATNGVSNQTKNTTVIVGDVPPVASYTTSSPDFLGQPSSFNSASQGTNLVYRWDFGDGTAPLVTGQSAVNHTYASAGNFQTTLTITNPLGSSNAAQTVKILSLPTASFSSSSPDSLGQTTAFNNTSFGGGDDPANVSYLWNFGDGAGSTLKNPTHTYGAVGTYYVTLTVYNSVGNDVFMAPVQITDIPISGLSAGNNGPKQIGASVNLSAQISAGSNVSYQWNFGDGSPAQNGANVNHLYPTAGLYTATVTASNGAGSQQANTAVLITDIPPTANFSTSSPDLLGQQTSFNSSSSGTNLSYQWNFGDGTAPLNTTLASVWHNYAGPGNFTVVLTASNNAGSDSKQKTVKILARPTANFNHSGPDSLGQTSVFTNTSLSGGETEAAMSYLWRFGDGDYSAQKNPTHIYSAVGIYQVTLTASHSLASDTVTQSVVIADVPIAGLSIETDSPTLLGAETALRAEISAGSNVAYIWNPGDGSGPLNGPAISHIYPTAGLYTAWLTASNSLSLQTLSATVVISDIAPTASFVSSSPDLLGQITAFENFSGGSNLSYSWNFGDASPLLITVSTTITHEYLAPGLYTVGLTATNSAGTDSFWQNVEIIDTISPPTASFSASSPVQLGQPMSFINTSLDGGDSVISYTWNFGDGAASAQKHPVHTYSQVGTYTVSLDASNTRGADSFSATVSVVDAPITGLSINGPASTELTALTSLSATISGGSNVSYQWHLGDGAAGTGQSISHTYGALGSYTVVLTAGNSRGSQTVSHTVSIIDQAINNLAVSSSAPTAIGQATNFTASVTSGTNVAYLWRFGDGYSATVQTPAHLYTATGIYSVTIIAANSRGSRIASLNAPVIEQGVAGLGINHSGPGFIGSQIQFSATVSAGTNINYSWNFGDGYGAGGQNVVHTYNDTGNYTVSLTAENSLNSQVIRAVVSVQDIPVSGLSISGDSFLPLGTPARLNASVSGGSNISYQWNFGDGFTSTLRTPVHTYTAVGTYTAVVSAFNSFNSQTLSHNVTVFEWDTPIENLGIQSDSPVYISQTVRFTPTHSAGNNIAYQWDFGDGYSSTLPTPVHTYTAVGSYTVVLVAGNNRGSAISQTLVSVSDRPISGLKIQHDGPTPLGEASQLWAGVEAGSNITYQWHLGDGQSAAGPNVSHVYSQTGVYQIVLTAANSAGSVFSQTALTVYEPDEPISDLHISNNSPSLFQRPTQFTATIGGGSNISYQWDFGDGYTSTLQNPAHSYANVGDYTVLLTASNSWGSLLKTGSARVIDIPVAGLDFSYPEPVVAGQALTFTALVSAGSHIVFNWDFGDGQSAAGPAVSHAYAQPGVYQVLLSGSNSANLLEVSRPVYVAVPANKDYALFLPLVLK